MNRILKVGMLVLAGICLLASIATLASDSPVSRQCRTQCWLNELLHLLFGEGGARYVLATLWLTIGIGCLWLFLSRDQTDKS